MGLESRKTCQGVTPCASSGRLPSILFIGPPHLGFAQIAKSIHGVIDHIGTKSNPFARKTTGSLSSESASRSSITAREVGEITPPKIEKRSSIRLEMRASAQKYCVKIPRIGRIFSGGEAPLSSAKKLALPFQSGASNAKKGPASEEAGLTICRDQSPLRRDQIRLKPSSPSTLTSEA